MNKLCYICREKPLNRNNKIVSETDLYGDVYQNHFVCNDCFKDVEKVDIVGD